ncbi:hypothetical protein [Haloarchaeobius iranensis]|nr:hypothetical protein [Haloarchaeobius iranensis]
MTPPAEEAQHAAEREQRVDTEPVAHGLVGLGGVGVHHRPSPPASAA